MNPRTDLDALVNELNAFGGRKPVSASRLEEWLATLGQLGASDLYLVAGVPPSVRVHGTIRALDEAVLDGDDIEDAVLAALPHATAERFRAGGVVDASLRRPPNARFRVNLHRERGRAAASIRALPARPPSLTELDLPSSFEALTRIAHGLVLIAGPTGSGKTTTIAALVDAVNRRDSKHIITIEDPVEYEHTHDRSIIEHIEIGSDAPDFPSALRAAMRQSPDIIVVGEMRDPETMRMALAAGETGHLVFTSLHASDASSAVSRIADAFPPERQGTVRQELSLALSAVATQFLLPRVGGGRVAATDLLMVGYGARQHIRKNALQHLHQEITISRKEGSFTLEDALAQLVRRGVLDVNEARTRAAHREELEGLLR